MWWRGRGSASARLEGYADPKPNVLARPPARRTEMCCVVVVRSAIPVREFITREQDQVPMQKSTGTEIDVADDVSHVEGRKLPIDDERVERAGLGVEEDGVWTDQVPDGANVVLRAGEREINVD